jgi:hypothetical protein
MNRPHVGPLGALQVTLEAEESTQCADDQRGYDRVGATAIDVRTDHNRDLRHDNADDTTDGH